MLNDPIAIKLAEDHYWLSIADGDLLQFLLGIVIGRNLEVEISEPDVSPLAIQGPKAEELTAKVFGETVHDIKFFRYKKLQFLDKKFVVARSGWSKQGGFEIYVEGTEYGMPLWEAFFEAGKDLNVRAGCPNLIERIEGGLLSFGSDMTRQDTPVEAGLAKFCNAPNEYLGKATIEKQKREGPDRIIRPISISGNDDLPHNANGWKVLFDDKQVGLIASAAWSPDFKTNVAIGMIDRDYWDPGSVLQLDTGADIRSIEVQDKFWI
jgi:dimethylsulfoniopropionate demethylase